MRVLPLSHNDVLYVAQRMREWDRREIYATQWTDDPVDLTATVMACGTFSWVCGLDRPIAALGALPIWPGVWSVWMFGTDEVPRIGLSLTRFARRSMMAALLESGAHRAECRSIEGHEDAQKWLESLGARREATHRMAGRNGETFHTYAWTRDDVLPQRPQG